MKNKGVFICLIISFIFYSYPTYATDTSVKREALKSKYSSEELLILQKLSKEIESENQKATAIEVNRIVSSTIDFKFDTPPIILDDRTLVPVRAITESLEASVTWYPSSRKVEIVKDTKKIVLSIDNNEVKVNSNEKKIDVPAKIFKNRTYIPLRFVVEEYGLNIKYDSKTGVITIEKE